MAHQSGITIEWHRPHQTHHHMTGPTSTVFRQTRFRPDSIEVSPSKTRRSIPKISTSRWRHRCQSDTSNIPRWSQRANFTSPNRFQVYRFSWWQDIRHHRTQMQRSVFCHSRCQQVSDLRMSPLRTEIKQIKQEESGKTEYPVLWAGNEVNVEDTIQMDDRSIRGQLSRPLTSKRGKVIGKTDLRYLVVTPFGHPNNTLASMGSNPFPELIGHRWSSTYSWYHIEYSRYHITYSWYHILHSWDHIVYSWYHIVYMWYHEKCLLMIHKGYENIRKSGSFDQLDRHREHALIFRWW